MVQKELLFSLFAQNWSDRRINKATGLHRTTISQYRKAWQQNQNRKPPSDLSLSPSTSKENPAHEAAQNVPLGQNEVPTDGVAHFELPTDPEKVITESSKSKSRGADYHDIILKKLAAGQHARSIFQDLVLEHGYGGGYDSIKRYIRKLKHGHPKLYARIETPAGEEAQVDFGKGAPTLKNGRWQKPWLCNDALPQPLQLSGSCLAAGCRELHWLSPARL
jgi:hypothetical protein